MCWIDLTKPFSPPMRCCEARAGVFNCQERLRKQFSALWKSCEIRAILCMYGKDARKPPMRCCEARAILFNCQERLRKQFSLL